MTVLISKDGDRVSQENNGDYVSIITPLDASKTKFNFGPASARDSTVFTCERPGGDPTEKDARLVPSQVLPEWLEYIQTKHDVTNVIILLADEELAIYDEDGLIAAYTAAGMTVYHIPYKSDDSAAKILKTLHDIDKQKGEKVVAHCTHGMGRSGRVAALWLIERYGLSPEDAINEALEAARQGGVERMGAPRELTEWIETLKK